MNIVSRAHLLLLAPIFAFGAGLLIGWAAIETAELVKKEPATLLDAAARGDDDAIFRLISAGEDPGAPIILTRAIFQWRLGDKVSPLLLAIARGDFDNVTYMLRHTQHLADPPNDEAMCVAMRSGNYRMVQFLMKMGVASPSQNACGSKERAHGLGG